MHKVVLFDTETTGSALSPVETQPVDLQPFIIQIHASMIQYDDSGHEIIETVSSFVSGAPSIPYRITEITGIKHADLASAPQWVDIRSKFFDMVERAGAVCAHNLSFDAKMLQVEEQRLGFPKPLQDVKRRCSLTMSRKLNTTASSHSLGKLYRHLFDEDLEAAHTAEGDVRGLLRVYMDLVSKGAWRVDG